MWGGGLAEGWKAALPGGSEPQTIDKHVAHPDDSHLPFFIFLLLSTFSSPSPYPGSLLALHSDGLLSWAFPLRPPTSKHVLEFKGFNPTHVVECDALDNYLHDLLNKVAYLMSRCPNPLKKKWEGLIKMLLNIVNVWQHVCRLDRVLKPLDWVLFSPMISSLALPLQCPSKLCHQIRYNGDGLLCATKKCISNNYLQ